MITLSAMNIYPIKSCGGIAVLDWEVDGFGLRDDRRWMVATPDGGLVSQRECPELALVRVAVSDVAPDGRRAGDARAGAAPESAGWPPRRR